MNREREGDAELENQSKFFIVICDKETIVAVSGLVWHWPWLASPLKSLQEGNSLLCSVPRNGLARVSRPWGILRPILSRLDRIVKYPGMPGPAMLWPPTLLVTRTQITTDASTVTSHRLLRGSQPSLSFIPPPRIPEKIYEAETI